MLEPRRLAARASAQRIATEQKWQLGQEVGYQVRFENRTSSTTKLQILTEGIFAHRLQNNPDLDGIGCLILDEFHERSAQTDVALAMARELQQLSRPDLKIIVMSATLETSRLSEFLGDCPIISVPGLLYPVETIWDREPQTLVTLPAFYKRVSEAIHELVSGARPSSGSILVFLPGAGEISQVRRMIEGYCQSKNVSVHELHGSLSLEKQTEVLRPTSQHKVILCTNIAESSLTVPGVATVIDTGLAKVLRQEGAGFARLSLSRISQFSATQRAGRAGREMKGYNYRLWNKQDEASMPEAEAPELLRSDLADTVLLLSRLGISDPKTFSWFERPFDKNLDAAVKLLKRLNAVDPNGQITETGKKLSRWPTHPRIAAMLERSIEIGCVKLGAQVAALLSEKDIFDGSNLHSFAQSDSDLVARIYSLERQDPPEFFKRAVKQFEQLASAVSKPSKLSIEDNLEEILLAGFSDRLAWRRKQGEPRAKLITGEGVRLHDSSLTKNASLFLCLDATSPRGSNEITITKATPISAERIKLKFKTEIKQIRRTDFDSDTGQLVTEEFLALEELPLEAPKRRGATLEEAASMLPHLFVKQWEKILSEHEDSRRWIERIEFARLHLSELAWPVIDDVFKLSLAESFLMGEKSLDEALKKDLTPYLNMMLSSEQQKTLSIQIPEGFNIPSGRFVKVDYSAQGQPTIEARLQEFFGWMDSPTIVNGKIKIRVQLLGPNYRPVQITSDLKGFWSSSYQEVRKELRARYPKHDWPENPLVAIAKQRFK